MVCTYVYQRLYNVMHPGHGHYNYISISIYTAAGILSIYITSICKIFFNGLDLSAWLFIVYIARSFEKYTIAYNINMIFYGIAVSSSATLIYNTYVKLIYLRHEVQVECSQYRKSRVSHAYIVC